MSRQNRPHFWQAAIEKVHERLTQPLTWYPYPALISFGLVMILIGHLIPGLNPRLGSRANVIEFPAARVSDSVLWLGVFAENDRVVLTTSDRMRFDWPLVATAADLKQFSNYLDQRRRKEALAAGLAHATTFDKTMVVLSLDQRLKYVHIRPILNALAAAGISKYGFETKLTASTPHHPGH